MVLLTWSLKGGGPILTIVVLSVRISIRFWIGGRADPVGGKCKFKLSIVDNLLVLGRVYTVRVSVVLERERAAVMRNPYERKLHDIKGASCTVKSLCSLNM